VGKYKSGNYRDLPIQKRFQKVTETASHLKIFGAEGRIGQLVNDFNKLLKKSEFKLV